MMVEYLQQWLTRTVTVSVLISIALSVTPPGTVKKVAQLASGLIMALVLLSPFSSGLPDLSIELPDASEFDNSSGSGLMKEIIEEETAAYIVNKAQAMGLSVGVRVICDDSGVYPVPAHVTVRSESPEEAERQLGPIIEQELGIGPARQHYTYDKGGG